MKRKEIKIEELVIHASGDYLTDNFPEKEYNDMDEAQVNSFIEEHKAESYEYYLTHELFEMIECSAESLARFMESKGIKIIRN